MRSGGEDASDVIDELHRLPFCKDLLPFPMVRPLVTVPSLAVRLWIARAGSASSGSLLSTSVSTLKPRIAFADVLPPTGELWMDVDWEITKQCFSGNAEKSIRRSH